MSFDKNVLSVKSVTIVVLACLLIYYVFFHKAKDNTLNLQPPVVVVQHPKLVNMADYITQTGTTVAFNSVDLVARIEGYLTKIEFTDGTFVKKGQELFVVEPEPYLEKLKEAQATLDAQKASYAYAKAEYDRQKQMYKENATSLNSVEKWLAKSEETKAQIAEAVANVQIAAINYSYTHIASPFDGRIGRHLVDVGNLVGNGKATDLATVEQISPIYVYFNPNELDLIKIRQAAKAHDIKPKDINTIPIYVAMQNEKGFPHEGKLDFVNTGLNASTGTMEFRGILTNKDYALLPGLFVQVRIPISSPTPRLTVPDTAVLYDQIGPYLLLVDKNNNVELRRVKLGGLEQDIRAINKGISAEDKVIVDGLQNATPGNPVTVRLSA
jgi:RND family efflux transporter MFP subunit